MKVKKKLVKQMMLLLRNLEGDEVKMDEVEPIYEGGLVAGYSFRIQSKKKPKLKIVKEESERD